MIMTIIRTQQLDAASGDVADGWQHSITNTNDIALTLAADVYTRDTVIGGIAGGTSFYSRFNPAGQRKWLVRAKTAAEVYLYYTMHLYYVWRLALTTHVRKANA
jgi:hypothetical protein